MEDNKIEYFAMNLTCYNISYVNVNAVSSFNKNNNNTCTNIGSVFKFDAFSDLDGLPFPLYYGYEWRLIIAAFMIITLVKGLHYRTIIFKHLWSNDYGKPINTLIMMDQMNGLLLGFGVAVRAAAIISPVALSQHFGFDFCRWLSFPGTVYIVGKITWSFLIALMRVGYIMAQVRAY